MSALFGPEGKSSPYRYGLHRDLVSNLGDWMLPLPQRSVLFLMLNPSTADATEDDPTIRRCIGFARTWCYTDLFVANLFALRATDPRKLIGAQDPVGPMNDSAILMLATEADLVIAAWGAFPRAAARANAVVELLRSNHIPSLHHLGLTKGGHPKHPLYLRADLKPIEWAATKEKHDAATG